jgi:hypothetical protein
VLEVASGAACEVEFVGDRVAAATALAAEDDPAVADEAVDGVGAEVGLPVDVAVLTLLWHFGSVLRNPSMAVRTTMRNRWRSEQLGDDGAADLRQRGLWGRSDGGHVFFFQPAALRRRCCR